MNRHERRAAKAAERNSDDSFREWATIGGDEDITYSGFLAAWAAAGDVAEPDAARVMLNLFVSCFRTVAGAGADVMNDEEVYDGMNLLICAGLIEIQFRAKDDETWEVRSRPLIDGKPLYSEPFTSYSRGNAGRPPPRRGR